MNDRSQITNIAHRNIVCHDSLLIENKQHLIAVLSSEVNVHFILKFKLKTLMLR